MIIDRALQDRIAFIEEGIREHIIKALDDIPGTRLIRCQTVYENDKGIIASVTVEGWGPSLHVRRLDWRQNVGAAIQRARRIAEGADPDRVDQDLANGVLPFRDPNILRGRQAHDIVAAYATTLEYVLHVQRALSRTAADLGMAAPLAVPHDAADLAIGHVRASVPLLDLLVAKRGAATVAEGIRSTIRRLIREDQGERDDAIGTGASALSGDPCGLTGHLGEPVYWESTSIGSAMFDGLFLTLPCELPDTVTIAAVGRTVGKIARTGIPTLDAARIDGILPSEAGDASELELTVPSCAMGEHPALRALLA